MKVLLIGGTGFMGPSTVSYLQKSGHSVTVFHRGNHPTPQGAQEMVGDHHRLPDYRTDFERGHFDVVIDFILSSGCQAKELTRTFRGITSRIVALSSMDVYRAMGIIHGTEPGPFQDLPLTEDSELRTQQNTYSPEAMKKVREIYPWADDQYDKIPVEQAVLEDCDLYGTVLRLPMVYGPGDPLHRFHAMLKRMDDGRKQIILSEDVAAFRSPRGFVDNVGAAIALAATSDKAAGRVYNICEAESFSELEWSKKIADAAGWHGQFVVLPRERTPKHLLYPGNAAQHLVASSERIRDELGFREPVSEAEAIRRTIEWERAHQPPAPHLMPFDYAAEDEALAQLKASA
jgi:nucleoside-diphosphate-sugar epimerase